jgi:hypothetical protein
MFTKDYISSLSRMQLVNSANTHVRAMYNMSGQLFLGQPELMPK